MHYSCGRFGGGIPGEPRVIVVAADINNTAMRGASFNEGGGGWGGPKPGGGGKKKGEGDGEGPSGENKPFAALIESRCSSITSRKVFVRHMATEGTRFSGRISLSYHRFKPERNGSPLISHLTFRLTVQVVFVLRGVSFADHSPDGPKTSEQPLQEPPRGRLALKPAVARVASDHAAVQFRALSLRQPGASTVIVELQDTVGKVFLLFLARRLVLSAVVALVSPTDPGLNGTAGVYGKDVAKDTLGRGEVHLWGAGCFGIEAAKGRRIGEGCVEARQGRGRCARFVNERHKWSWSSEQLEKRRPGQDRPQRKKTKRGRA